MMETIKNNANIERQWDALLFDICRSIRYNERRAVFWGRLDKITSAISLILGSGVLVGLLKSYEDVAAAGALLVTVMTAFNLVWGFGRQEFLHCSLAARYRDIEANMRSSHPSEDELKAAFRARLATENDEPPARAILNVMCHNELVTAMGYPSTQRIKLSVMQRLFAQFIDIGANKFRYETE